MMYRLGVLFIVLCLCSCKKESDELSFDIIPHIELLSTSDNTIVEFEESISFSISYQDGDGNIGNPDPDINSLFVKDSRLENEDAFYIQPLAPLDAEISITGSLNIQLASTFILGNGESEQTVFSIYIVDRDGNKSNVIETETITIVRQ